jgi:DNA-binding beta-propeller fold protein YncE
MSFKSLHSSIGRLTGLALAAGIGLLLLASPALALDAADLLPATPVKVFEGGDALGLRHPSDVLVAPDGRVLVLDGVSNRVVAYDATGKFLNSFGRGGKGEGELDMPLGMAMDAKGRLYITDTRNHRIQIYSSDGAYRSQLALPYEKGMHKPDPTDVAVDDKRGLLYVVDNENHRVLIFGLEDHDYIGTVGKMGHNRGEFRWPFSISLDSDGIAYVVDVVNTVVRTIRPDEKWGFGNDIGGWGVEKGELFRPKGVAVSAAGQVFVADSYLGIVQVFDRAGNFQGVLSGGEGKVRRFMTPTRLYVDRQGLLYVVEMFADRVSVFKVGS